MPQLVFTDAKIPAPKKNCCEIAEYFGVECKDCNKPRKVKQPKNTCLKTRPKENPYEVWVYNDWEWHVLKKWQSNDDKPYARWFCLVKSPIVPDGEMGDCYVKDIKQYARRVSTSY